MAKSDLPNYSWLQFQIDWLYQPKTARLSNAEFGAYCRLYLLAGKCDAGGWLGQEGEAYSLADIAFALRWSEEEAGRVLDALASAGLIEMDGDGVTIRGFLQDQGPGQDEARAKWRDRQQRRRAKVKAEEIENREEQNREEENREESHGDVTVTSEDVTRDNGNPGASRRKPVSSLDDPIKTAVEASFRISPNWSTKNAREFLKWATVSQIKPEGVQEFSRWWYANDWRGKRGQPPGLDQIREYWPQSSSSTSAALHYEDPNARAKLDAIFGADGD